MKKYIKNIIGLLLGCMLLISCSDYLDVQPEASLLEEDVFSSENGVQTILNGVYTNMASTSTYGGNLTMGTIEVLGQQFDVSAFNHSLGDLGSYTYDASTVQTNMDAIWSGNYATIVNINQFLTGLETYPGVLTTEKANILKGEAMGLRAMLHFDLLRLFGPIYSVSSNELAIPYNTKAAINYNEILPANKVMELILNDLATAEELLINDPIIEYGTISVSEEDSYDLVEGNEGYGYDGTDFYRYRNLRLNYYAVKALQARVNLYAGNTTAALTAAKTVIDEASQWFNWTTIAAGSPDRIFSTEVLFGIQNSNILSRQYAYYGENLPETAILSANQDQLDEIVFEGNGNDYRTNTTWLLPSAGEKLYKTFNKFLGVNTNYKFMQPLIRMSEMYYIVAETETDPSVALQYLNEVRINRNIEALTLSDNLENEIFKEYRREFYGEGQMFFYYKRKNLAEIPDSSSDSDALIPMDKFTYVVPLPLSETDYR